MAKKKKKAPPDACNLLKSLLAEIDEGVALLRPHYRDESDDELRDRAQAMLGERYRLGRWPTAAEIAEHLPAEN